MTRLESLRDADTLNKFANLLGYKPKSLTFILYKIPENKKYFEFSIPKKNGTQRIIKAPTDKLKKLQRHLANLLNDCYEEINRTQYKGKKISHGFVRNCSIITNAANHKNKRYVFNIDLQEFFPSINFGRVLGFFNKNNHFQLNPRISTIIAQISCHKNELPQGSPCSPIISNLIGHILDIRLVNLAKLTKCTYSRYADDLTYSTSKKDFPQQIAVMKNSNEWTVGKSLMKEIKRANFFINPEKISMQYKISRQITTGLVVNKKINVKREYYKIARSMCHELFRNDKFYFNKKISIQNGIEEDKGKILKEYGSLYQLESILGFIKHVNTPKDTRDLIERQYKPKGITKLIREFLFYKHFFALKKPLIVCEGKTDIIYIKSALRALSSNYTELVNKHDKKIEFNFKFLNISKHFQDIFEMPTGTSGLKLLINIYNKYMNLYKGNGKKYPVIMIVDNDEGSKEIKSILKARLKLSSISPNDYYNVTENLYIVFVSEKDGFEIEDLFDDKTLKTNLDGKTLSRNKDINPETEYGKHIFAEKVIKANKRNIDFSGFEPLFDKISFVMENYSSNH